MRHRARTRVLVAIGLAALMLLLCAGAMAPATGEVRVDSVAVDGAGVLLELRADIPATSRGVAVGLVF